MTDTALERARVSRFAALREFWYYFSVNRGAVLGLFVVVPVALVSHAGLDVQSHWKVYLPAVLLSFAAMIPPIVWAEKHGHNRTVLLGSVAFMGLSVLALIPSLHSPGWIAFLLFVYFAVFNILEAQLPSLVSRFAPPAGKGRSSAKPDVVSQVAAVRAFQRRHADASPAALAALQAAAARGGNVFEALMAGYRRYAAH